MTQRLTRFTHACVRLEGERGVLVIDPGIWTEPDALVGVDAVLVTHEHPDHISSDLLERLDLPVFAPAGADIAMSGLTRVSSGEEFMAAGYPVRAIGNLHAVTYAEEPRCPNLGYLIADRVYHPGDALALPQALVDTLLVPIFGPWLKISEAIDFVRAVNPLHAVAIHDAQLNDRGVASVGGWIAANTKTHYQWLAPGESA